MDAATLALLNGFVAAYSSHLVTLGAENVQVPTLSAEQLQVLACALADAACTANPVEAGASNMQWQDWAIAETTAQVEQAFDAMLRTTR